MTNIAKQPIKIKSHLTGATIWTGETNRDIVAYPLTSDGELAFEALVKSGGHSGILASNGGTVPAGTPPTLTIPDPPTAVGPVNIKIQAEDLAVTGTGSFDGTIGDGHCIGPLDNSSQYRLFTFTLPKTASNYAIQLEYRANSDQPGTYSIIINGTGTNGSLGSGGSPGTLTDYPHDGSGGGPRTVLIPNVSLVQGENKIRFQGKAGHNLLLDWLKVTRPGD